MDIVYTKFALSLNKDSHTPNLFNSFDFIDIPSNC